MKRRVALLIGAVGLSAAVSPATAARADVLAATGPVDAGAVVMVGQGALSPGLNGVTQVQTVSFGSIVAEIVSTTPQSAGGGSCTFNGTSNTGSPIVDWHVNGSCSSASTAVSCSLTISWPNSAFTVGPLGVVNGSCNGGTVIGAAQWLPTSVNPTTLFVIGLEFGYLA
jgi:hypothetical protein